MPPTTKQEKQLLRSSQQAAARLSRRIAALERVRAAVQANPTAAQLEKVHSIAVLADREATSVLNKIGQLAAQLTGARMKRAFRPTAEERQIAPDSVHALDDALLASVAFLHQPLLAALEVTRVLSGDRAYRKARMVLAAFDWGKVAVLDQIPWSGLATKVLDTLTGSDTDQALSSLLVRPVSVRAANEIAFLTHLKATFAITAASSSLNLLTTVRSTLHRP
jgi:hypothetical protein